MDIAILEARAIIIMDRSTITRTILMPVISIITYNILTICIPSPIISTPIIHIPVKNSLVAVQVAQAKEVTMVLETV